jgi:hypothetical protein
VQSRGNNILSYFAFPRLGIDIPLWPGDIVFFNPNEPHCVRSRVDSADEISCMSLYIKSDNIGKHDNAIAIIPDEQKFLDYYHKIK